ncbi:uncharacterized protein EI97DRAFT_468874 [Westerdykella ornata]|uniref:DNA2/NAM7 helicase-like C-terminal domain-containing protein n=1 Tax=Westerdykella ornata TaxID=318751 RepID=A0A6A6JEN0_WESOR|nr:uncharacterized protein EI97DRAFT_468874 [Westerdykella ornata]KAF2274438.1 hypothetical protein EI97DRAFT_468874 [Westerdykella ornata]
MGCSTTRCPGPSTMSVIEVIRAPSRRPCSPALVRRRRVWLPCAPPPRVGRLQTKGRRWRLSRTSSRNPVFLSTGAVASMKIATRYAHSIRASRNVSPAAALLRECSVFAPPTAEFFVNVNSPDTFDPVTMSRYNQGGINMIRKLIGEFLTVPGLQEKDILVVSFYSLDVKHLTKALRADNRDGMRVSSIDGSQGSEARVVILHCVRGCAGDKKSPFTPFMTDWKRLNVATSRAKDLLIMVGNMEGWDACKREHEARFEQSAKTLGLLIKSLKDGRCVTE